jgi:riboflavin synthase
MFTGLVEAVGRVGACAAVPGGLRLEVIAPLGGDVRPGESVAVNGVCLTVIGADAGGLAFDVGPETLRVTALSQLAPGDLVNLERAMRADTRVGGHFVQGHVDAAGTVTSIRPEADFTWITCSYPADRAALLIPKGAIAVDGISLTVAALDDERFDVQIVPFTWSHTNLSARRVGDRVNLEFDMLGKYAVRAAELASRRAAPLLS